jgi:ubiquinone/menaquinone biosynthesis C-methylase UbiE
LPIKDKIFDASICMAGALNHIPNIKVALVEIKRVTKKRMIASLYNFFSPYGIWINLRCFIVVYKNIKKLIIKPTSKPKFNGIHKYLRILDIGENPIWDSALTLRQNV